MIKYLLKIILLTFLVANLATASPKIVAYLGADTQWHLSKTQLQQLHSSLQHVNYVDYAFIRFKQDAAANTVLDLSQADINNLQIIRAANPQLPIILSIGGWGARDAFEFVKSAEKRQKFIQSVIQTIKQLHALGLNIQGIDVDWENEVLASSAEIQGAGLLITNLRQSLGPRFIISNAVPATAAYWSKYPNAKIWANAVNWTTIMAYDHYGTFGPTAELAAALYDSDIGKFRSAHYPYSITSAHYAIQHYLEQGLKAQHMLLGIPFYCHSYYVANHHGLHSTVIDPNISSQVDYSVAFNQYGSALFKQSADAVEDGRHSTNYYGLIPIAHTSITRFMSCDGPQTIAAKMAYVKGDNPNKTALAGVSFWSLMQDLPYEDENSLLKAINKQLFPLK